MAQSESKLRTYIFITILCFVSAALLSTVSLSLKSRQEKEKLSYRNKQLLLSAQILNYENTFQILLPDKTFEEAKWDNFELIKDINAPKATKIAIEKVCEKRLIPLLTNDKGEIFTFEEIGLSFSTYLTKHEHDGYYNLPYKLFYKILPNETSNKKDLAYGYIFPVNGYGLWDAIYGLLAVFPNMNNILGISWYEQKETPGLGAEISTPWWQKQFFNKELFQTSNDAQIDFSRARLGINIIPHTEMERLSPSKKGHAVDAITGATMTMHGVQRALNSSLEPYRALFNKLRKEYEKKKDHYETS